MNFSNLREYFFQAVSNSSWANEGYLVTLNLEKDAEFLEELQRLTNAFGIGIIHLNPENISQSEIIFSAKTNNSLDFSTIDRLITENPDFKEFIKYIYLVNSDNFKTLRGEYDTTFEDDESAFGYAQDKGIISFQD